MGSSDESPIAPTRALDRGTAGADGRMSAPSAQRNGPELLPVLRDVLDARGTLLEIGSGTGQHAAFFAPHFPGWRWLPSDADPSVFGSIRAWREFAGATTVAEPAVVDLLHPPSPTASVVDAMLCVNVLHIAPRKAMGGLMALAARRLRTGGPLVVYGPLFRRGEVPASSNLEFHQRLRDRDPEYGVRREDDLLAAAGDSGLGLDRIFRMPVNNTAVVLRRG